MEVLCDKVNSTSWPVQTVLQSQTHTGHLFPFYTPIPCNIAYSKDRHLSTQPLNLPSELLLRYLLLSISSSYILPAIALLALWLSPKCSQAPTRMCVIALSWAYSLSQAAAMSLIRVLLIAPHHPDHNQKALVLKSEKQFLGEPYL